MGKSLINDIILTDDKWLLKNGVDKKYNEIDQSMPAINDLSQFSKEQNVEFYFALPPSKRMHYHLNYLLIFTHMHRKI